MATGGEKKRQKHQLQDTRTPTSNILMSTRQMKPTPRGVGHTTLTSEWPTRVYYLGGKYKYAGAKLRGSSDQTLWGTRPCIYDLQSCVLGALRRLISLRQLPTYLPTYFRWLVAALMRPGIASEHVMTGLHPGKVQAMPLIYEPSFGRRGTT